MQAPGRMDSEGLLALPGGDWAITAPISQKIVRVDVRGQAETWIAGALGWPGALAAFAGFTLPSAVLMVLFAMVAPRVGGPAGAGAAPGR